MVISTYNYYEMLSEELELLLFFKSNKNLLLLLQHYLFANKEMYVCVCARVCVHVLCFDVYRLV